MANEFFQAGSVPQTNSRGASAQIRGEFARIAAGFDKLAPMAGYGGMLTRVNNSGTAMTNSRISDNGSIAAVDGDEIVTATAEQVLTGKTIAWSENTFTGFGDAATKAAGTGADEVLLLTVSGQLPAMDASLLTGISMDSLGGVIGIDKGGTGASTLDGAQSALGINLKANSHNAVLTGAPVAPNPPTGSSNTQIATTQFVQEALVEAGGLTPSNNPPLMNGVANAGSATQASRDDHVHPTDTSRAPLESPTFTGVPAAPTAAANTNTTQLATTAFVNAERSNVATLTNKTLSLGSNTISGTIAQFNTAVTDADLATLAGVETFTNKTLTNCVANTQLTSDASTKIATTAFVSNLLAQQPTGVQLSNTVPLMDGVAAVGTDTTAAHGDHVHPTDTSRAPLASPTFTGTPAAPTAAAATNTTQIATTAFVFAERSNAASLTNKTIALGSNTVSGTIAQFNTAVTDADLATLAGAETLTNKTIALGSNTISGTLAQFNTAVTDADLASLAGTETLTNKTLNLSSNTVSGTKAQFDTACSDDNFAYLATAQNFTAPQRSAILTDNDGSFDLSSKQNFKCTTAAALTLTFTNQQDGLSGAVIFINSSNHTVSAHANTKLTASDLAKLSVTGTYRIDYLSDGTNAYCSVIGSYS